MSENKCFEELNNETDLGCDASDLLDDSNIPNRTLKVFDKIDLIKEELEKACPKVILCADILVLATRDGIVLGLGNMKFNSVNVAKAVKTAKVLGTVGLVGCGGAYAAFNSMYTVEGGHRAIVFNRLIGIKEKVYPDGTHLMIPWFERPIIYDVRARPHLVESTAGSSDLQIVKIGLRVLTRPNSDKLPTIYRTLGENYNERVLPSIIEETLKAVVARYNASQLITQRESGNKEYFDSELPASILHWMMSITGLAFGNEYRAAIESKQIAAQEAERAKYVVEKAEQDKRSAIIRAEGEATIARLIGEAIGNNPAFLALRRIEAAREMSTDNIKVFQPCVLECR